MTELHDRPSRAAGPALPFNAELRAVWDVQADRSYDILKRDGGSGQIALLTRNGRGSVWIAGHRPIPLETNTLILLDAGSIRRYCCSADVWSFWWFEFTPAAPLPYALNTTYPTVATRDDEEAFPQIFTKLQHPSYPIRSLASATFCTMLHRWLADAKQRREKTPHREIIEALIERIHHDVGEDWSGPRLAKEAGLSESTFRIAFRRATGQSPGQFVRIARLQAAYQMCEQHLYTLAAIAEKLNFSSPFHLSAAFKKQFGISPSQV